MNQLPLAPHRAHRRRTSRALASVVLVVGLGFAASTQLGLLGGCGAASCTGYDSCDASSAASRCPHYTCICNSGATIETPGTCRSDSTCETPTDCADKCSQKNDSCDSPATCLALAPVSCTCPDGTRYSLIHWSCKQARQEVVTDKECNDLCGISTPGTGGGGAGP